MDGSLLKDISEILGTLGTAAILFLRQSNKNKAHQTRMNKEMREIKDEIEDLKQKKADKEVTDIHLGTIRTNIVEMRSDISEGQKEINGSIQGLTATLNKLDGTVSMLTQFMKINKAAL